MPPSKFGYFNQGIMPVISCVNKASSTKGYTFKEMIDALAIALQRDFVPVWGTPAKLQIVPEVQKGTWGMVFTDTADEANALGYHDIETKEGLPLSKVFVKTSYDYGEEPSVTASHELYEMLVDPAIQMMAVNYKTGVIYAYEVADAPQTEMYKIGKVPVSNFVYPSHFESFRKPRSAKNPDVRFDFMGTCKKPFEIRPGGYMSIFSSGQWSQIFGSKRGRFEFKPEAHPRAVARSQKASLIALDAPAGSTLTVIAANGTELTEFQPLLANIG
jgi:hypothetical protein